MIPLARAGGTMTELEEPTGTGSAMALLKKLLVALVLLALMAVAGYLQIERNHRTYFTQTKGGALVISKGNYFLWGSRPYVPEDPPQAEAYTPIALPAGVGPVASARFYEREALDRYLFDLLASWADPRIRTDDPAQMKEGFLYVERASRLSGLSGTQAKKLRELRAEVAYFEAREGIEQAAALLGEAREKLKLASEGSGHAREAMLLLEQIEPANTLVAHAARSARLGSRRSEEVPTYYPVPVSVTPAAKPPAAVPAAADAPAQERPQSYVLPAPYPVEATAAPKVAPEPSKMPSAAPAEPSPAVDAAGERPLDAER